MLVLWLQCKLITGPFPWTPSSMSWTSSIRWTAGFRRLTQCYSNSSQMLVCSSLCSDMSRFSTTPFSQSSLIASINMICFRSAKSTVAKRGDASKPDAKVTSEAKKQAVMTLVLGLPMGFMGAAFDAWLVPGMHSKELPSVVVMAAQVVAAFIILDFVYYWGHRSLHHESFYFIHKVHHQYHAVNTWAAPYMHPLEGVGALIMLSFISWLIRMHGLAKFIFILLFGMLSAYQHTGYDLPFIPLEISRFHVFHHSHNVGAYGVITTFWDRVFGTDKPYRRWRQKQLQPVP